MYILFTSHNRGKIVEVKKIFSSTRYQLVSLNDQQLLKELEVKIPANLIVAELGKTLKENALLKAKTFGQFTHLPCVADDTGIILEAFPNFPGVNSSRWFPGDDQQRNLALLKKLKNHKNRQAKFQTVLCLWVYAKEPIFFTGEIRGQIAQEIMGHKGFGYDSIFIPNGYQESFAQLGLKIKNKISHRAQVWQSLINYLEKN